MDFLNRKEAAVGKSIWDECIKGCPWRTQSFSSTMLDENGNLKHLCKAVNMECKAVNCAPYAMFSGSETEGE